MIGYQKKNGLKKKKTKYNIFLKDGVLEQNIKKKIFLKNLLTLIEKKYDTNLKWRKK